MFEPERWTRSDLLKLMTAEGTLQQELFARARQVRAEHCGDVVTMRGVIEISNYCYKQCGYCAMRRPNEGLQRFRLTADEIMEIAAEIKEARISTAFLQAGQDPQCDAVLEQVVPRIKHDLGLDVLLCVGERSRAVYQRWADLGADSYILKFETSDPLLYQEIIHVPIGHRLQCVEWIRAAGMKLGTGNIVGLPGQTNQTLVDDVLFAIALRPDFVSCSPFIANQGTPYEGHGEGSLNITLNTIAIWRIALKTCLTPSVSALEKLEVDGQLAGLSAGANVITINFTPEARRKQYAIYSKQRFVVGLDHALRTIQRAGLQPGRVPVLQVQ